jgi:hypothetical protein
MAEMAAISEFSLLSSSLAELELEEEEESSSSSPINKGGGGGCACRFRLRRCCLAVGDKWCDEFSNSLSISLVNEAVLWFVLD